VFEKERSLVSKNSNSLKATSKGTSVTSKASTWKRVSIIFIATILLSSAVTFNSGYFEVEAKKPGSSTEGPISWSNGFPSGPHSNVNIHGKKLSYNCANDGKGKGANFGGSVFVPIDTQAARDANQAPTNISNDTIGDINFVSNKRSKIVNGIVRDPCSAPFGNSTSPSGDNNTAALVELPPGEHQVYWRSLGNPFNGQGPNKGNTSAMITNPALLDTCDFLPTEYTDGSVVQWFDPDCTDCDAGDTASGNRTLAYFVNGTEMYENSTGTTAGFSLFETIYNDTDTTETVTPGDIRLANANNTSWIFNDGSTVANNDDDEDPSQSLFNFTNNFLYNDTNTSTDFSLAETVYDDVDGSGTITPGDIRVANAASVGLDPDAGGDLLTCEDSEQFVGLGLVSNKGAFGFDEDGKTLVRFDETDTDNENPGKGSKHGKSKAMNVTGLFKWTGFVCDTTELDVFPADTPDNKLTFEDFDVNMDGVINGTDIAFLNQTAIFGAVFTEDTITFAEGNNTGVPGTVPDAIDNDDEFNEWIDIILEAIVDGGFTNDDGLPICQFFESEWVFNVADIVLYGFDYENKGASLTQLRFYPVEETSFTSEG